MRGVLVRGIAIWALIALAETAQGALRVLLLEPAVGALQARQIAVFTGSIVIVVVATASARWLGARSRRELAAVGLLWLTLMLAFEVLLGRLVAGLSWERIAADYDPRQGGLLLFGMAVIAIAPLVAARMRHLSGPAASTRRRPPRGP